MPLPFPGYTWGLNHHAVSLAPQNLFGLLNAAALFKGKVASRNVADAINRFLDHNKVLTRNIRRGHPDAWRDYQQVLAELGFIYSTKVLRPITLTPIAFALLDGLLGYREVVTTQALRYQYPNGFHYDLSNRVEGLLARSGRAQTVDDLIELQLKTGVLIKPAVLMLELLFALYDTDPASAFLTTDEVRAYLVETYNYKQPIPDPRMIIEHRIRNLQSQRFGERRNIQDWMKVLWNTDLFARRDDDGVALSGTALRSRERVESLIAYHKTPESYWLPPDSSKNSRLDWFRHFGSMSLRSQWVLLEPDLTANYQIENYVRGRDDIAEASAAQDEEIATEFGDIRLREPIPASPQQRSNFVDFTPPTTAELEGRYKRSEKNRNLHAQMVTELAKIFGSRGAKVQEDRGSVDLLVQAPNDGESIIEVKTVSLRNFKYRVRYGIGQLFEYQYRRKTEARSTSSLALAISSDIRDNDPVIRFLNDHLSISLLARQDAGSYKAFRAAEGTPLDLL
jgi:hypothetical protein